MGGNLRTNSESKEVDWVAPDLMDGLQMHPSMRLRIAHYLERRGSPFIG